MTVADALQSREDVRRYVAALEVRSVDAQPRLRVWRAAGRMTLAALLGYSALQYYFLEVSLTIMALPRLTPLAG